MRIRKIIYFIVRPEKNKNEKIKNADRLRCRGHLRIQDVFQVTAALVLNIYGELTLKAPNKYCSRRHFNMFTFIFQRK